MTRSATALSARLKERIERKYRELGYSIGWRLLYSPESVLRGARVAFIGVNPGGDRAPADHAVFAMESGSAYADERWNAKRAPGQSKLQRQALSLFSIIGERPEKVLAGNLVPFRSPRWKELQNKDQGLEFGTGIWEEILAVTKPQLIIGMGQETWSPLKRLLNIESTERVLVEWGNIGAERGRSNGHTFVGLPHLSHFPIVTRQESQKALRALLGAHYRQG